MDEQIAIDRILENENLTDELEDDDADWLLNWATSHVKPLVASATDDEAGGEKVNNVMAVARSLNKMVAARSSKPPKELASDIQNFVGLYNQTFDRPAVDQAAMAVLTPQSVAPNLATEPPQEFMQHLLDFAEAPAAAQPAAPKPAAPATQSAIKKAKAGAKPEESTGEDPDNETMEL